MERKNTYTPDELKQELKKKPKYNNSKVYLENGQVVDSKLENKHKQNFERLLAEGKIKVYKWQVPVQLLPTFKHKGETIRSITYIADHYIIDNNNIVTIYDTKGFLNDVAKLKIKLLKYRYPNLNFKLLKAPAKEKKVSPEARENPETKKGPAAKPDLFS